MSYDSRDPLPQEEVRNLIAFAEDRGLKFLLGCDANSHHVGPPTASSRRKQPSAGGTRNWPGSGWRSKNYSTGQDALARQITRRLSDREHFRVRLSRILSQGNRPHLGCLKLPNGKYTENETKCLELYGNSLPGFPGDRTSLHYL